MGIRYEHLPELGIDGAARKNLKTQSDYDALFALYARDLLPKHPEALGRIREWVHSGKRS